jgi:hypothetical protein
MILPLLRAIIPGSAACATRKGAVRLVAMMSFQSSSLKSTSGLRRWMPALLTRMPAVIALDGADGGARRPPSPRRTPMRRVETEIGHACAAAAAPASFRSAPRSRRLAEALRDREAQAAVSAGDERDLAREIERVRGHE